MITIKQKASKQRKTTGNNNNNDNSKPVLSKELADCVEVRHPFIFPHRDITFLKR